MTNMDQLNVRQTDGVHMRVSIRRKDVMDALSADQLAHWPTITSVSRWAIPRLVYRKIRYLKPPLNAPYTIFPIRQFPDRPISADKARQSALQYRIQIDSGIASVQKAAGLLLQWLRQTPVSEE